MRASKVLAPMTHEIQIENENYACTEPYAGAHHHCRATETFEVVVQHITECHQIYGKAFSAAPLFMS